MKNIHFRVMAMTLAMSLGGVAQSNAAMITLPGQYTNIDLAASTAWNNQTGGGISVGDVENLTFNKFDPTLGTLTAMHIAFSSLGAWDVWVTASGGEFAAGDTEFLFAFGVFVSGWGGVAGGGASENVGCYSPTGSCGAGSFSVPGSTEDYYYTFATLSDATQLTDFVASIASPTFDVVVDAELILNTGSCTGSCTADAAYSLDGQRIAGAEGRYPEVVISYEYTEAAVPEPATVALFGLGLAGLGAFRRKLVH